MEDFTHLVFSGYVPQASFDEAFRRSQVTPSTSGRIKAAQSGRLGRGGLSLHLKYHYDLSLWPEVH